MRILVIGCGRSGTKYLSHAMSSVGLDLGHEVAGRDGLVNWQFTPSNTNVWCPYGEKNHPGHKAFDVILHQVRNPLDTISSCQTITDASWKYISNFVPIYNDESLVYRCMQYWLHWNRLARESSTWTYKIEELPEQYDNFCKKIKREDLITQEKKDIIAVFNKNLNTRHTSYRKLKREDLFNCNEELAEEIVKDGAYYGYSI